MAGRLRHYRDHRPADDISMADRRLYNNRGVRRPAASDDPPLPTASDVCGVGAVRAFWVPTPTLLIYTCAAPGPNPIGKRREALREEIEPVVGSAEPMGGDAFLVDLALLKVDVPRPLPTLRDIASAPIGHTITRLRLASGGWTTLQRRRCKYSRGRT